MEPVVSMMRFELYRQSIAGRATLRDADCHHGVSLTSASPQCSNLFTIEGNGMRHQAGEQMVGTKGSNVGFREDNHVGGISRRLMDEGNGFARVF